MGISEDEFFDMNMRQFYARRHGYTQREQQEWERARYVGYFSLMPHTGKRKRLRISDLGHFPWEDSAPKFDEQTPEELAKINERHKRQLELFKQKNGIS